MRGYLLVMGLLLASGAHAWDDCKYEAESSDKLKAGRTKLVEIDARAGSLRVEGKPGAKEVSVDATACAAG